MHQRIAASARPSAAATVLAVVGAAALTAVSAQVSFGYPVPTTLQTFAVLGSAAFLGARRGAAAQLLYLGAGAAGLPVFADGLGGLDWLTRADLSHASGGYLWGYPLAALAVGWICERYGRSFYVTVPAMLVGSVCLYATGLVWLHQAIPVPWTGAGATTLHYGLWPFVLGDLAKIFAAAAVVDPAAPWGGLLRRIPLE
ncbi:MAG TPA: biotin transporter BioY [Gaiellales bacterium]|jgi:biotin transport system substrate-specific component|nr:biotin transporter BioY [Gaiellales bacterium]